MRGKEVLGLALLVGALLAGCGTIGVIPDSEAGPYPHNYKEVTDKYVKAHFKDPSSVKDTEISKPIPYRVFDRRGYLICFRANAKNSYGGYTGVQTSAFILSPEGTQDYGSSACAREKVVYEPWPDLVGSSKP